MRCKNCIFFKPKAIQRLMGECENELMDKGYGDIPDAVRNGGITVEDDEGWGALVSENFGCVNFKPKENVHDKTEIVFYYKDTGMDINDDIKSQYFVDGRGNVWSDYLVEECENILWRIKKCTE